LSNPSFVISLCPGMGKGMKLNSETRAFEMRMLENQILNLVGEKREVAMKAYRKLFSSTSEDLVYLMRL